MGTSNNKTTMLIILFSVASLMLSVVNAHFKWEENAPKCKSIFILAGQSNMAGRGYDATPAQRDSVLKPDNSILRLNAKLAWELASDPLHGDIDVGKPNAVGPGMPFAKSVLAASSPDRVLGLVPCAIGGTKISQWARGQKLYNDMIARTKAAVALGGGKVEALLWFQGESDTEDVEDAKNYRCRFEKFVADVRADLELPSLNVVMAVISTVDNKTHLDLLKVVRENQFAVTLSNFARVDSMNLATGPDNVHLNVASQITMGQNFATAYLDMAKCSSSSSSAKAAAVSEVSGSVEASGGVSVEIGESPLITKDVTGSFEYATDYISGVIAGISGEATVNEAPSQGNGGY